MFLLPGSIRSTTSLSTTRRPRLQKHHHSRRHHSLYLQPSTTTSLPPIHQQHYHHVTTMAAIISTPQPPLPSPPTHRHAPPMRPHSTAATSAAPKSQTYLFGAAEVAAVEWGRMGGTWRCAGGAGSGGCGVEMMAAMVVT
nr:hypothetical protein [Tanacetum cinerariifolium]